MDLKINAVTVYSCADSIKSIVNDVSPSHCRIQAVTVSSSTSRPLLVNSHFPLTADRDCDSSELLEVLDTIDNAIETNQCNAEVSMLTHVRRIQETLQDLRMFPLTSPASMRSRESVTPQSSTSSDAVSNSVLESFIQWTLS